MNAPDPLFTPPPIAAGQVVRSRETGTEFEVSRVTRSGGTTLVWLRFPGGQHENPEAICRFLPAFAPVGAAPAADGPALAALADRLDAAWQAAMAEIGVCPGAIRALADVATVAMELRGEISPIPEPEHAEAESCD
jgi:hypothetical protein